MLFDLSLIFLGFGILLTLLFGGSIRDLLLCRGIFVSLLSSSCCLFPGLLGFFSSFLICLRRMFSSLLFVSSLLGSSFFASILSSSLFLSSSVSQRFLGICVLNSLFASGLSFLELLLLRLSRLFSSSLSSSDLLLLGNLISLLFGGGFGFLAPREGSCFSLFTGLFILSLLFSGSGGSFLLSLGLSLGLLLGGLGLSFLDHGGLLLTLLLGGLGLGGLLLGSLLFGLLSQFSLLLLLALGLLSGLSLGKSVLLGLLFLSCLFGDLALPGGLVLSLLCSCLFCLLFLLSFRHFLLFGSLEGPQLVLVCLAAHSEVHYAT